MSRQNLSVEEFYPAFLARITAMSRMHDLLASGTWSSASVQALVGIALGPFRNVKGRDNVRLLGDEIRLPPNPATTLGMVLHELATNAAKYGALSAAGGTVDVSWHATGSDMPSGRRLELRWNEGGGPPPNTDHPAGFGTQFIIRSVEYELGGTASLDFSPEGLSCVISFPLACSTGSLATEEVGRGTDNS
jgi:two-component system CheB/CheR fusion protein